MDGPREHYAKWSKSEREINSVWFHLYVESDRQNTERKQHEKRLADTEDREETVAASGRGVRGWSRWTVLRGTNSSYKLNRPQTVIRIIINDIMIIS